MAVTIHDVAEKAGVSITTVSLVLNNRPSRISASTKQRVWDSAQQLGLHRARQQHVSGKRVIGVVVPDIRNPFFADLYAYFTRAAGAKGFYTITASTEDDVEQEMACIDVLLERAPEGILLVKAARNTRADEARLKEKIKASGVPFVTVDRKLDAGNGRWITVDHREGARLAVAHLLELGHKRIGCIAGPKRDVVNAERLAGYRDALSAAGIPYDDSLVCAGNYRIETGSKHLPYLLGKSVTAIFCFNDLMAIGVYKGCRSYNLRVPEDLSVMGFDDITLCEALEVPLSTVNQPTKEIGAAAAEQLANLIDEPRKAQNVLLRPALRVRASTSYPPKSP